MKKVVYRHPTTCCQGPRKKTCVEYYNEQTQVVIHDKYILGIKQSLLKSTKCGTVFESFKKIAKSYVLYGIYFCTYDEIKKEVDPQQLN